MTPVTLDRRPVIVAAARSPITASGGALAALSAQEIASPVLRRLRDGVVRLRAEPRDVVLGNCMGPGGNIARLCSLEAGFGSSVPALTIDRQCASGLSAIAVAAQDLVREPGVMVAGGVESASTAPTRSWPVGHDHAGEPYARAPFAPTGWPDPDMGEAADVLADVRGISRSRQDEYAVRSHERAFAAQSAGLFESEIVSVGDVIKDDRPRDGFTEERLSRFPAAFREGGTVTAANSCGINDGCAAVTIVDGELAQAQNLPGLRIVAMASAGFDPAQPALGLVPAASAALHQAGLHISDMDVIEFNEAFAAQMIACADDLGIDDSLICRQGGALALGHPWGASGAVIMVRMFSQLVTQDVGRFGLAAIAAGGGQGVAVVVERCH